MADYTALLHATIRVRDVERTLAFYRDGLGLPEMLRLHRPDGSLFLIYLRITDRNFLEIFPNGKTEAAGANTATGLHHICLGVEDIHQTRARLTERGVGVFAWTPGPHGSVLGPASGDPVKLGQDGNLQFWLLDPDGNRVEIMQMAPDCLQFQALARMRREGLIAQDWPT